MEFADLKRRAGVTVGVEQRYRGIPSQHDPRESLIRSPVLMRH